MWTGESGCNHVFTEYLLVTKVRLPESMTNSSFSPLMYNKNTLVRAS